MNELSSALSMALEAGRLRCRERVPFRCRSSTRLFFLTKRDSQSVSQTVISLSHPALHPPPALRPAPPLPV